MFGFSAVVLVGVVALWLIGMRRSPAAIPEEKAAIYNRRWIVWGGIVLPCVSIVLLLSFGIPQGKRMLPLPVEGEQPLKVEVIGHQWWWEVRYPESGVVTANQMNLPAGRPLDIHVTSADVIHSFWIPRLGGKIDMIPGRTNVIRLEADRPATHRGQCSEFCGMQHTHMILYSEVQTAEDFADWIRARQQWQAPEPDATTRDLFQRECAACHQVSSLKGSPVQTTDETLLIGPDLGDVASRSHLGAGVLRNEAGAIRRWLSEHQRLKPENRMPSLDHLEDRELDVLADWLETLTP
jgi:cytochrome c oxidase subunit 2